jgi:hypothetical protein
VDAFVVYDERAEPIAVLVVKTLPIERFLIVLVALVETTRYKLEVPSIITGKSPTYLVFKYVYEEYRYDEIVEYENLTVDTDELNDVVNR